MFQRFNISKMRSNKKTFRIIVRKRKIGFSTNTIEATKVLNVRKNISIRKPPVSKKNNVIIFRRKEISTKRDTLFDKRNRISRRIMLTFKTAKPKRDTVVYQYEERKEER